MELINVFCKGQYQPHDDLLNNAKTSIESSAPTIWSVIEACVVDTNRANINKFNVDKAVTLIIAECIKHRSNTGTDVQYLVGCSLVAQGVSKNVGP